VRPTRTSKEPGPREYPHFVVQVWKGRLPTPAEYRGTSIAKQFESGRIGGRKIDVEERYADNPEGRGDLINIIRAERDADVYYLRSPRHSRERIGTGILFRESFVENGL
jgi:hypothetical protein